VLVASGSLFQNETLRGGGILTLSLRCWINPPSLTGGSAFATRADDRSKPRRVGGVSSGLVHGIERAAILLQDSARPIIDALALIGDISAPDGGGTCSTFSEVRQSNLVAIWR